MAIKEEKTPEQVREDLSKSYPSVNNPMNIIKGQDIKTGDADGNPFIVQVVEPGSVLVSAIVFAKDEEDAKARLLEGIRESASVADEDSPGHQKNKSVTKSFDNERWLKVKNARAKSVYTAYENGWVFVTPFDKTIIGRISWSQSDTFI